ncbi:hypothetical protein [Flavobacterium hibisci]|uniref:hypothetical protein n=1 Tax=Flavobacterium hibisci TaxID=1914462 RepID=UPI001CC195CE|nr:hypothetical protein [Flavobacterium hibisci]MBZ4043232.1 hypothetical protein [Flavobacterium hibisci]
MKVAEKVCEVAKTCEGLVDAGSWYDEKNDRIIMMSLWENAESAMKASENYVQ